MTKKHGIAKLYSKFFANRSLDPSAVVVNNQAEYKIF